VNPGRLGRQPVVLASKTKRFHHNSLLVYDNSKVLWLKTLVFPAAGKSFVIKDNYFASTRKAFVPARKACLTPRKGRRPGHNVLLQLERLLNQLESPLRQLERPFHQLESLFQQNKSELAAKGVFWPVMFRNLTERVSKWNRHGLSGKAKRKFLATDETPNERRFFQARGAGNCVQVAATARIKPRQQRC
jgi:hypothetical protein